MSLCHSLGIVKYPRRNMSRLYFTTGLTHLVGQTNLYRCYLNGSMNIKIQLVFLYYIIYHCIRFLEYLNTLGIGQTPPPYILFLRRADSTKR